MSLSSLLSSAGVLSRFRFFLMLLVLYSCKYNHPRVGTLSSASSWYIVPKILIWRALQRLVVSVNEGVGLSARYLNGEVRTALCHY